MFPEFDGTQACATMDQEMFFPSSLDDTRKSLQLVVPICKSCSMYTKCFTYSRNTEVSKVSGLVLCMTAQVIQPHLTWLVDWKENDEVHEAFKDIDKSLEEIWKV